MDTLFQKLRPRIIGRQRVDTSPPFLQFRGECRLILSCRSTSFSYSGILVNKGTVKIAERQTGLRYMVHFPLAAEKALASAKLTEAIGSISLTDYREFSSSDAQMRSFMKGLQEAGDHCGKCSTAIPPNAKFCQGCGNRLDVTSIIGPLLDESVDALSLSRALCERVKPKFPRVGETSLGSGWKRKLWESSG